MRTALCHCRLLSLPQTRCPLSRGQSHCPRTSQPSCCCDLAACHPHPRTACVGKHWKEAAGLRWLTPPSPISHPPSSPQLSSRLWHPTCKAAGLGVIQTRCFRGTLFQVMTSPEAHVKGSAQPGARAFCSSLLGPPWDLRLLPPGSQASRGPLKPSVRPQQLFLYHSFLSLCIN